MKKFTLLFFYTIILMLVVALSFAGCKKKEDNPPPAPDLLPLTTMVMNFEDFPVADDSVVNANPDDYKSWSHASDLLSKWSVLLKNELLVSITAYAEAFKHQANYHSSNANWVWSYTFMVKSQSNIYTLDAELTAFKQNEQVVWEMRISKNAYYDNFLFFKGKSTTDQLGGYWIINENPDDPEEYLRIDWVESGNGQKGIQYKIIQDGSPDKTSYISYGEVGGEFDRFYHIYTMRHDNNCDIKWNNVGKYGRVYDVWHFEDVDWHCWNTSLKDIYCQ